MMGAGLLTLLATTDLDGVTAIAGDTKTFAGVVVGLGLLGTGVAYVLYYFVVDRLGAVTAASSTYLPPVVALALGALVAGEAIVLLDGLGIVLVLAGVLASARLPDSVLDRLKSLASRPMTGVQIVKAASAPPLCEAAGPQATRDSLSSRTI
jgi:drug/metabolite transporter (DMT)-like permease